MELAASDCFGDHAEFERALPTRFDAQPARLPDQK
jgi:hypothetical protein